ncbi:MAG: DUF5930 domain-containing protein, partial [Planktomarina sp.]
MAYGNNCKRALSDMGLRHRIHLFMERHVPEKRLFLRTNSETRFMRLGSGTQIFAGLGCALIVGW